MIQNFYASHPHCCVECHSLALKSLIIWDTLVSSWFDYLSRSLASRVMTPVILLTATYTCVPTACHTYTYLTAARCTYAPLTFKLLLWQHQLHTWLPSEWAGNLSGCRCHVCPCIWHEEILSRTAALTQLWTILTLPHVMTCWAIQYILIPSISSLRPFHFPLYLPISFPPLVLSSPCLLFPPSLSPLPPPLPPSLLAPLIHPFSLLLPSLSPFLLLLSSPFSLLLSSPSTSSPISSSLFLISILVMQGIMWCLIHFA